MCFCRCPIGLAVLMLGVGILIGGILPYLFVKWVLAIALIAAGIVLLKSCC